VPTVCINALDDPFIDEESLPTETDLGDRDVQLVYHPHGGHAGFILHCGEGPWPAHGFLAEELARAIQHMHYAHTQEGS
jgi:predicted alpha/beta-fold hydrolase